MMSFTPAEQEYLRQGWHHFRAGEYFATHEAWEEVWQGLRGRRRLFWQALIHLAVGAYHLQSGNRIGCKSQWQKALQKCDTLQQAEAPVTPVPLQQLGDLLRACLAAVDHGTEPWPEITAFNATVVPEAWLDFE
jgi:hypothetical protein